MKTIRINACDFWPDFDIKEHFFGVLLSKYYNLEISDDPDYVFCSVFSRDFLRYDNAVRIFYTGECQSPDFNLYDYAIGFDYLSYGDRYLRYPLCILDDDRIDTAVSRGGVCVPDDISKKEGFCSFVYSNSESDPMRKTLFERLSRYKKVSAGGKYLNNNGNSVDSKIDFEKKHKFSIACENYSFPGYTTEKIMDSFSAGTIPIYWGDPRIGEVFNTDSFVNVMDFPSVEEAVAYVEALDQDEAEYLRVRNSPIFIDQDYKMKMQDSMVHYLRNIFEQDKEDALRRNKGCWGRKYEKMQDRTQSTIFSKMMNLVGR